MCLQKPRFLVFAFVALVVLGWGQVLAWAESSATVKGFGVGQAKMTLSPAATYLYPKSADSRGQRSQAAGAGAFIDLLSHLIVDTSYKQRSGAAKGFTINVPLTVEYGIKVGGLYFDKLYQNGHAAQLSAIVHFDLFRTLSLGGGAYHATFSGDLPSGTKSTSSGFLWDAQLTFLPTRLVRPTVGMRLITSGALTGTQYIVGLTIGDSL